MAGRRRSPLRIPVYVVTLALMILMALVMVFFNPLIAGIELAIVVAIFIYYRYSDGHRRREVSRYMEFMIRNVDTAGRQAVADIPLPVVMIRQDTMELLWCNDHFVSISGFSRWAGASLGDVVPDLADLRPERLKPEHAPVVTIGNRRYRVDSRTYRVRRSNTASLLFTDITEQETLRQELTLAAPIVSIVQVDNYEEISKTATGFDRSLLMVAIDSKVSKWAERANAMCVRSDRDKYFLTYEERHLRRFIDEKFDVMDAVRQIKVGGQSGPTLSMGIGRGGASYAENMQFARLALDMALSRGGDQTVIKNPQTYEYYGGNTREVEKRSKVRSRVLANAMREMIQTSSCVFVTGHKFSDMDSVGSSVGIMAICRKLDIPARMVVDVTATSAKVLVEKLQALPEYAHAFISEREALQMLDRNSLVVVMDTNRPDYIDAPELLRQCKRVAVVDHHRRAADFIDNAVLNLHEPYASSASELVLEMLQYILMPADILRAEAECLLAGITLDTDNFTKKTGVRTFEAAAFARRIGADTIEVKNLFRENRDNYVMRCDIIRHAIPYRNHMLIASSETPVTRPVAGQAADAMMNISGVDASFVVYRSDNETHISARSMGKVNVQLILEALGGGGSLLGAGAQMGDRPVADVVEQLKKAIDSHCQTVES